MPPLNRVPSYECSVWRRSVNISFNSDIYPNIMNRLDTASLPMSPISSLTFMFRTLVVSPTGTLTHFDII